MLKNPSHRLWMMMLGIVIGGMLMSVYISAKVAKYGADRQAEQQRAVREEQRSIACNLVNRILAGYAEDPPVSETGKNVVEAWREEYRALNCSPKE